MLTRSLHLTILSRAYNLSPLWKITYTRMFLKSKYIPGNSKFLLLYTIILLGVPARSQVGTVTQEITKLPDFALQKQCAQECFVFANEYCPLDMLGMNVGCVEMQCDSTNKKWQARNDCYCRPDNQQPAQEYLDSCIQKSCSIGDASVDASSATSIYLHYCEEKGYAVTTPASNEATTTSFAKPSQTSAGAGSASGPTGVTVDPSSGASSRSGLSVAAIVGIVVAAVAGLILVGLCVWFYKRSHPPTPPPRPDPVFPSKNLYDGSGPGPDIDPSDSISQVGMQQPQRLPPTVISLTSGSGQPSAAYYR
jgi:hypothetical protein